MEFLLHLSKKLNNMKIKTFSITQIYKNKLFNVTPYLRQKNTQAFTMIVFTLVSLSLFGVFAINPTLSTIANLQKQLEDSKFVDESLSKKITNLSVLQQKYNQLGKDIPIALAALPKNPSVPMLMSQIHLIALNTNVSIVSLQSHQVELSKTIDGPDKYSSYSYSLSVKGAHDNITKFISQLTSFERIVTIDSLSISKEGADSTLLLNMKGEVYFKK